MQNFNISIEVIKGGYILNYPTFQKDEQDQIIHDWVREIFTSQQKMNKKIKDVLELIETTFPSE